MSLSYSKKLMAKVKILESCAGLDFAYSAGEEVEENQHTQGLINAGLAEIIKDFKEKGAAKKDK